MKVASVIMGWSVEAVIGVRGAVALYTCDRCRVNGRGNVAQLVVELKDSPDHIHNPKGMPAPEALIAHMRDVHGVASC